MASSAGLSALLQKTTIEDHEAVLKECNAALKQSKSDSELLHVKVVALLSLDRFEDALKIFQDYPERLNKRATFERAYALYKVGNLAEARNVAKEATDGRGLKHVRAQAVRLFCTVISGKLLICSVISRGRFRECIRVV